MREVPVLERDERAAGRIGWDRHLAPVIADRPEIALRRFEQAETLGAAAPAALLRDRDRNDVVARAIERADDRCRRAQRHLVLARATAEDDPNPQPPRHPFSPPLLTRRGQAWLRGASRTKFFAGL